MSRLWHRVKQYVRYDLKEIVNPSSLPNPPDYVAPVKLRWQDWRRVIQEGNRKYWEGWRSSQETENELHEIRHSKEGSSLRHELTQTAKAAAQKGQGLQPMLRYIYETRARSYRDAVQQFIEGYKEGFAEQSAAQTKNSAQFGKQQQELQSEDAADQDSKQSARSSNT